MTLLIAGTLSAGAPSASTSYRLTRNGVNQGGQPKTATSFQLNGSAGELGQGLATSTSYELGDGLMKIYYYPGTVTDLSVQPGTGQGEIDLTWTAPGADGDRRTATKYVIKFSTYTSPGSIDDQAEFESATTFVQTLSPASPDGTETLTLTGLQPGTSYYIAVEARDAADNQAYLSNSTYTWSQVTLLAVDITNQNGAADTYGFGTVTMSSAVVSTATIRVTNVGTAASTWSLNAATTTAGSPWQLTSGALGLNQLRVSAGFDEAQPSVGGFGAEDRMTPTDQSATGTAFSIDGSTTGVSVPIGDSRLIWFLLETPLASSTTDQQQIQVTVTANP
jgi:hypothetical protein